MKRFPFVLLAVSLVAMAACAKTETPPAPPPAPGHINLHVFCPGTPGGAGVRVLPWKVRVTVGGQLTWNVPPANGMDSIIVAPVDMNQWPFAQPSFSLKSGTTTTPLSPTASSGTYRYKLTAVCGTDTIVIDPEIIIT